MSTAEARAAEWRLCDSRAGRGAQGEKDSARRTSLGRRCRGRHDRKSDYGRPAGGRAASLERQEAGSADLAGAGKASWGRTISRRGTARQRDRAGSEHAGGGGRGGSVLSGRERRAWGGQPGGGGAPAAGHLGPTCPSQGGGGERARWCRCKGDGVQRRRERGQGRRVRGAGRSGWALQARVHASMPGRGGTFSVARRGRADPTLPSLSRAAERGTCDASDAAVWSGRSAAKRLGMGA